ncbi:hypothetical protein IRJ41_000339 [Triplophysa rosa]|uniref:HAT C-terminal dimerisation domain-containing protein n=1 Tax=Triplophysa rosa TaxID=992332 RepID=A0A9W7WEY2_TRIRA|nr:hypothetical protein IRJ41_000339 [Triplophysa rosa]
MQYVAALRELLVNCDFGMLADDMLRDQIVEKMCTPRIREHLLLETDLTLQKAITIAGQIESAVAEAKAMEHTETSVKVVHTGSRDGAKQRWRQTSATLEETTGGNSNDKTELRRLYFSALDHVLGEIDTRFSERNSKLATALAVLDPVSETFLDVKSMKPIMDLTNSSIVETECIVAKQFISRIKMEESQQKMAVMRLLSKQRKVLEAMPSVLSALKVAVTFGASTAMCENSFSMPKNVFTDHRRAMTHFRKSQLVQFAFERDLARKYRDEWNDLVLRKLNSSSSRRLQLF